MKKNPFEKTELKHFLHTFKRQPLLIKRAQGSYVWDHTGKKYLDFYSGLAVCGVGHTNAKVVRAVQGQLKKFLHVSNFFYTESQNAVAQALTARFRGSKVFFANSGAEANELAVKLARLWAHENKKRGRDIIVFDHAFHGRTLAMSAASSGFANKNKVYAPLPKEFKIAPFNDLEKTKALVTKNTIAIMLEPVQGEGGINVASAAFMKGLEKLCREQNLLLILDEIQSGMGRTGTFFAYEQYGVKPDIITLAKGLAGGMPLAAVLSAPRVSKVMKPGLHGTTFGGNPVACAASLEVLKMLTSQSLSAIQRSGRYLQQQLSAFHRYSTVKEIRGRGLMLAIDLHVDGTPYVDLARQRGLLINCTQGTVLRFLPPYFISAAEMKQALNILTSVFDTLEPARNS